MATHLTALRWVQAWPSAMEHGESLETEELHYRPPRRCGLDYKAPGAPSAAEEVVEFAAAV